MQKLLYVFASPNKLVLIFCLDRVSSNHVWAKLVFGLARPRPGRAFGRTSGWTSAAGRPAGLPAGAAGLPAGCPAGCPAARPAEQPSQANSRPGEAEQ